jgi:integrase/recombinase XerD
MPPATALASRLSQRLVAPDESPFPLARPSPVAAYLASLAAGSQPTQAAALRALAAILGSSNPHGCPWHQMGYAHVAALRARLVERYAPATANRMLAALRGVLLASWRLGLLTADQHAQLADVPPVRGVSTPRGRMLSRSEMGRLFKACAADGGLRGRRDAALLALGIWGGLRRAELCDLDVGDVADDAALLRVAVRCGKGSKARTVLVPGDAARLARSWQRERGAGRALFVAISRTGRVLYDRRLTPDAIGAILLRRCIEAGIDAATPHDLRRTYISTLLDRGVDIAVAARLAGHASTDTTYRYDRRGDDALRRAAELLGGTWEDA